MPFDLRENNLSGLSVITQPANVVAGPDNFIDLYTYAQQYMPELIPQLHMANGLGKITGFLQICGHESTYQSDKIEHMEEGRLHNTITDVAVVGTTFTSPIEHNLKVGDTVKVSDGDIERQATVTAITDEFIFEATNDAGGAFGFGGVVDVICDFSNSYEKGSADAVGSKRWNPNPYYNFTHILKQNYNVSVSDMAHKSWVQTPDGPRWFNHEIERTSTMFDNMVELTQIFHERKTTGNARGVIGVLPQIETRGNVGNEYIDDIEALSAVAFRAKQQGGCREFHIFHNHQQGAELRKMMSGVNAHYATGANYGSFDNSMDMALMLGFKSVYIDGCTFHFTPWSLLDDPSLLGAEKFRASGLACLIIPSGTKYAQENGNTVSKPYLSTRYRQGSGVNFKKEIKLFGPGGTAHKFDIQTTHFKSEFLNQVIGANEFHAVRTGAGYYA